MKFIPLTALCLGFFMVIMDATIVNVALPSISLGLNANISWLQWFVDGYTLMFASLLLLAGHISDHINKKKLFNAAIICFIVTSFCCGLANSVWSLTFFRLLQGASAAFIVPTSLALINCSFSESTSRSKAIGIWAAMGGIAAAAGPIAEALLIFIFNWRAVFFVNVPIGIICLVLSIKHITDVKKASKIKFDFFGQLFGMLCIAALAFGFIEAGRLGWGSFVVISSFLFFIIMLIAFLLTETKSKNPMFPLIFFQERNFTAAVLIGLMMNIGFYGELFILPLYFQQIRDYTVVMSGFALLPLMITVALSSYLSGKLVSIIGPKWPMVCGLFLGAIGFLSMLIVGEHSPLYWKLILPLTIIGFGIAFTMPAATVAIINSVASNRAGIASGAFNTSRQIGSLMGVAIFGTIIAASTNFISGMHITLLIAAGSFLLSAFISLTL